MPSSRPDAGTTLPEPSARTLFPGQESIGRWFGLVVFATVTARTALQTPGAGEPFVAWVRWALVTGLFLLFTVAYLRRGKATALASRPVEILLPLVVGSLPFVQGGPPSALVDPLVTTWPELQPFVRGMFRRVVVAREWAGLAVMAVGEAFAVASMLWLGRSFSLFAEVRELVTRGPYRVVRHPLYLGELVAIWGYTWLWPTAWTLGVAALITGLQIWRARVEERKLALHLPAYAEYRRRVGFLWPRLPTGGR